MRLSDAVADYLGHIKHEAGLTDATFYSYQSALRAFVKWLGANGYPDPDLSALATPVLRRYLHARSQAGVRPRTIRGDFAPIKALVVFLMGQGALAANPFDHLTLPKKDAPRRPTVSDEECAAILEACERLRTPRRVALARALLGSIIWCGLRASEALAVEIGHVSMESKTLTVVQGKGRKSRTLHPPAEALAAIREWLALRGANVKTPYLFAYDPKRRIAYNGLLHLLREVKLIAGLGDRQNIQPHALRRSFATRLMNRGASIRTIQAALGHSEPQTTFVYLAMSEEPARAMAELASLTPPAPAKQPEAAGGGGAGRQVNAPDRAGRPHRHPGTRNLRR